MTRRMIALGLIYVGISVAWLVLGGSVYYRTMSADGSLHERVAALWGEPQTQVSPDLTFTWPESKTVTETVKDTSTQEETRVTREVVEWRERPVLLDRSTLQVDLTLDQRRKGLLWYSTYGVRFRGDYAYVHGDATEGVLVITYRFPTAQANYDGFTLEVNGAADPQVTPASHDGAKIVQQRVPVRQGAVVPFTVAYRSRGLDWWRYSFGTDVNRVKNFHLAMTTDFDAIDFPDGTISPAHKEARGGGWRLTWESDNLISGFQIGMEMPRRINPGPLAAEISFFAPVSLLFFFVWMFVITLLEKVELHPMNYLFLAAAFFAFHLLFAYTVDHIDILPAFILSSGVSVFLVVSYLRLVVGLRFAALEAGVSQLAYLVFFSYAHFLEGFTGLVVTAGGIVTLFALMQLTGRIRWSEAFSRSGRVSQPAFAQPDPS